jgi:hypothetical protein
VCKQQQQQQQQEQCNSSSKKGVSLTHDSMNCAADTDTELNGSKCMPRLCNAVRLGNGHTARDCWRKLCAQDPGAWSRSSQLNYDEAAYGLYMHSKHFQ